MRGMLVGIINFVLGLIELILGLRFLFKLFGANQATPFVSWLYDTSQPLIAPFRNIFPATRIEGSFLIEWTTLVAMIVYMLIGYLILELIASLFRWSGRNDSL